MVRLKFKSSIENETIIHDIHLRQRVPEDEMERRHETFKARQWRFGKVV